MHEIALDIPLMTEFSILGELTLTFTFGLVSEIYIFSFYYT